MLRSFFSSYFTAVIRYFSVCALSNSSFSVNAGVCYIFSSWYVCFVICAAIVGGGGWEGLRHSRRKNHVCEWILYVTTSSWLKSALGAQHTVNSLCFVGKKHRRKKIQNEHWGWRKNMARKVLIFVSLTHGVDDFKMVSFASIRYIRFCLI